MGIVNKGNTVTKIQTGSRVLQRRKTDNSVVFTDSDIEIDVYINQADRATVGSLTITFNKSVNSVANWNVGSNINLFSQTSSASIVKNFNINQDNNGPGNGNNAQNYAGNRIYLNVYDITGITISQSGTGITGIILRLLSTFPNLINYMINVIIAPDFSFLQFVPSIRNLNVQISGAAFTNLSTLKTSSLCSLILRGFTSLQPDLISNLPSTLYYLQIVQMTSLRIDLKDYYTVGTGRISLVLGTIFALSYSGGASFPSAISDTANYRITDYIIFQPTFITSKLSGDQLSRFILDFANQVTSVTIASAARRLRFAGSSPNTSYVDALQPFYTSYSAAITHLNSMGVQVLLT